MSSEDGVWLPIGWCIEGGGGELNGSTRSAFTLQKAFVDVQLHVAGDPCVQLGNATTTTNPLMCASGQ